MMSARLTEETGKHEGSLMRTNARSNTRALRMLLWVDSETVAATVIKGELDAQQGAKLKTSKQCPGYNWCKLCTCVAHL